MGCETDNYRCPTTQKQQIQSTDSKSHYLSVKDVYDKKELSTKLVVKDHNADMYRVFHSREEFWEFNDGVAEHLRSFSEVVYGDLPQFPRIHVEFGSLHRLPGTKIVSLLKQILDGMLDVFRSKYSGITNVPKLPNDFVVMDEYGQNRHGYWTNDFHIQATSFAFTDYREAKEFTRHVRSSLPVEIKQSNKSKMRSGGHVAKTPQKKKYDILKGQRHHQQHNGDAKTGKELVQRSSNCWKPWELLVPKKRSHFETKYSIVEELVCIRFSIALFLVIEYSSFNRNCYTDDVQDVEGCSVLLVMFPDGIL
ncbi:hypothetical protein RhiirB3_508455 [Rhizophagus irregularis]|nr:hypothetical protein RhiirB3_508455 [Rhizophagus irregularis]